MPKEHGSQGKRYTSQQKAKILATARKENLTGAQVKERFGVSTLSSYRWRGPVRDSEKRGPGRLNGSGPVRVDSGVVRRAVRAQIQQMPPKIIREEIAAALRSLRRT